MSTMSAGCERSGSSASGFKRAQVRHRRQGNNPNRTDDFPLLVDFSNPHEHTNIIRVGDDEENNCCYGLVGYPGFLYFPQALSPSLQLELAYLAVSRFCEAPHATNIDLVDPKPHEELNSDARMWPLWKAASAEQNVATANHNPNTKKPYRCFQKLSWATMGYQYDWTARAYRESQKSPVPPILAKLSRHFAKFSPNTPSFTPSACIVNYYHTKSMMGGHRDDLELAHDKPVVSLSMGLAGVFLLGGTTKDDTPLPILLRPGDVLLLGGSSRMNYHGMARVIPHEVTLPPKGALTTTNQRNTQDTNTAVPREDEEYLHRFLKLHRININVRQVLPDGMDEIPEK